MSIFSTGRADIDKGRRQPTEKQNSAKRSPDDLKKHEVMAGIERLASRLIGADRESARELYKLLGDDVQVHRLRRTLGYGLRIDEDDSDGEAAPSKSNIEPSSAMLGVYSEQRYIGYVLAREGAGFEAYGDREQSLGAFKTEDEAATAVWKASQ
jgi:hypothetical protein